MYLTSVNIAQREILETPNGPVPTGIIKKPVLCKVQVSEYGIEGDTIVDTKVHGGLDQALYLYSQEDYDWWSERLGRKLSPGIFGENLTLSSFGEAPLVIGDKMQINNLVIEISAPRTPCFKLATRMGDPAFIKDFVQAARTGAYSRVITSGEISTGDDVILKKTTSGYPSVSEVFAACHSKKPDMEVVQRALLSPLGHFHKKIIQDIYDRSEA